jgi:hypothetical protein
LPPSCDISLKFPSLGTFTFRYEEVYVVGSGGSGGADDDDEKEEERAKDDDGEVVPHFFAARPTRMSLTPQQTRGIAAGIYELRYYRARTVTTTIPGRGKRATETVSRSVIDSLAAVSPPVRVAPWWQLAAEARRGAMNPTFRVRAARSLTLRAHPSYDAPAAAALSKGDEVLVAGDIVELASAASAESGAFGAARAGDGGDGVVAALRRSRLEWLAVQPPPGLFGFGEQSILSQRTLYLPPYLPGTDTIEKYQAFGQAGERVETRVAPWRYFCELDAPLVATRRWSVEYDTPEDFR